MVFSSNIQQPKWKYAIYKPQKKTGIPAWEASYRRFAAGESPEAIAMNPASGRPIQAMTVVSHIFDAMLQGYEVDARRLVKLSPPPNEGEWQRLEQAEATTGMNVAGDPDTSGMNNEKFLVTDFLKPIVDSASKEYKERSEEERKEFFFWCGKVKWYMHFKRLGYTPTFTSV